MSALIRIDTHRVRMLPKAMHGVGCSTCHRMQSNWAVYQPPENGDTAGKADGEIIPVCALCILYESGWASDIQTELKGLIQDTEKEIGSPFLKTQPGRLIHAADADRILSAIIVVSKVEEIQRRTGRGPEDLQNIIRKRSAY